MQAHIAHNIFPLISTIMQVDGRRKTHMLQHAIRLEDQRMINVLLEAGADVNTPVHIKDYVLVNGLH